MSNYPGTPEDRLYHRVLIVIGLVLIGCGIGLVGGVVYGAAKVIQHFT